LPEGACNENEEPGQQMGREHSDEKPDEVSDRDIAAEPAQLEAAGETDADEQQAEIDDLKDRLLRSQAEAENTRRRAARDVENAHKFALEKFAGELLPVVDSLEKAVEAARGDDNGGQIDEAIGQGVELSLKLFLDVLAKAGVEQIDPAGEPFDPQHHEAMAMVENPDAEPNSVLEVMQKGYTLNGRLIRAAMVIVSKAPTDTASAERGDA
jgi:molecular chaperone GrpE